MVKKTHAVSGKSGYVIGAGIVGACTAIQLLNTGKPVVLIEKNAPGSGASSGNAGSIGTASIPPFGLPGLYRKIPKVLFDPLFPLVLRRENILNSLKWFRRLISASDLSRVNKIADARASILSHAESAYTEMLSSLELQHLIQKTGLIHTYQDCHSFSNSALSHSLRKDRGINVMTLSGNELRDIEPNISDSVEAGYFYPGIGTCFDPGRMNRLLVEAFVERGGTYLQEEVREFEFDTGRCSNIITDRAKYPCEDIVLTAGVWSKELAKKLGCDVCLEAERGYHIMVDQPVVPLNTPLVSADYHIAITPMLSAIRLSTMSEFSSISASEVHRRAFGIMKQASNVVRNLDVRPTSRWVGPRPATPDSLPIIGRSTKFENVIFAFGHGHLGLTLASITGKLVSELCTGVETSVDISAFSPDRNFTGDHL